MPDMSMVLAALASAAAAEEGHGPCRDFKVQPGGLLVCPHGVTFAVTVPVARTEAAA